MLKIHTCLIAAFTGLVLLLTIILSLLLGRTAAGEMKQEIGEALSGTAYQMADKLDFFMFSRFGEIEVFSSLDALKKQDNSEEIRGVLNQLKSSLPSFSWVGYVDTEGRVLAATDEILEGVSIAERPVFKEGMKGSFIGDVHDAVLLAKLLPNPTGEPLQFVDISMPIRDESGETIGVLAAHLSWEWSKQVQDSILAPQQAWNKELDLFIVSKSNATVLLGPPEMVGKPLKLNTVSLAQEDKTGWELVTWPDGKSYLTGYAYGGGYLSYPGLGWTVLVRQPESVAFTPLLNLRQNFILTGIIAAILFAGLGWQVASRISRPIRELTETADQLRNGQAVEIQEYREFYDIYSLSRSFKCLIDSLDRTELALGNMKQLAHRDPLTGLPNRAALENYLERLLTEMNYKKEKLVFMYIDLDGFKAVNDTFGHQIGDTLLQKVAERLNLLTGELQYAVRLGGDEFLFLSRIPSEHEMAVQETCRLGQAIIEQINRLFVIEFHTISMSCSIGAAFYPDEDKHPSEVIQLADEYLYQSKQAGKNQLTIADKA